MSKIVDNRSIVRLGPRGDGPRGRRQNTIVTSGSVLQSHLNLQFGFFDVDVIVRGWNVEGDGLDALVHGSVVNIPTSFDPKIRGRYVKKVESCRGHGTS